MRPVRSDSNASLTRTPGGMQTWPLVGRMLLEGGNEALLAVPRLCVSQKPDKSEVIPALEGCSPECRFMKGLCRECRCRACPRCRCIDISGRALAPDICRHELEKRRDVVLGNFTTAAECRRACNVYTDGSTDRMEPRELHDYRRASTCNYFTFSRRVCVGHLESSLYLPGWTPSRAVHGVATCAPPQRAAPLALHRFVVLHTLASFACKPDTVARIKRAQRQLAGTPHIYRVLQISRATDQHMGEDTAATEALAGAVGRHVIALMGIAQLEQAFPGYAARMQTVKWTDERQPTWLANGCDLPALVWYQLHGGSLSKSVSHLWVLQHDVGWTGELPDILARFSPRADLLCDNIGAASSAWSHYDEHNHLPSHSRATCLLPITRYSTALMDEQVRGILAGNVSYCEMRAASTCVLAPWNCQSADLRHAPGLMGPFSAYTTIDEADLFATLETSSSKSKRRQQMEGRVRVPRTDKERCDLHWTGADQGSTGRLFHRVRAPYQSREPEADCPMMCPIWPAEKRCRDYAPLTCLGGARCCEPYRSPYDVETYSTPYPQWSLV